jgi:hypothetical protein
MIQVERKKPRERDISQRLKAERTKEDLRPTKAYSGTEKETAVIEEKETKVVLSDLCERSQAMSVTAEKWFYVRNTAGKALLSFQVCLNELDLEIEEGVWLDKKFPIVSKEIGGGWLECATLGYAKGFNGEWCLMIETFRSLPEDEDYAVPSWEQVETTGCQTVLSAPLRVQIAALKWMGCLITEIRERAGGTTEKSKADETA